MPSLQRNLTIFPGHCVPGSHEFEAYNFSSFQYGDRIIRTVDGQNFALLVAEDNVVDEVSEILAEIYKNRIDQMEQARRFDRVFGLSCDTLNGQELDASVGIVCPICKTAKVSYRDSDPPRFKSFLIPVISHENWLSKSREERHALIEDGLRARNLL